MDPGGSCCFCSPGLSKSEEKVQKVRPTCSPVVTAPKGTQRGQQAPSVGQAEALQLLLLDSSLVDLLERPGVFP